MSEVLKWLASIGAGAVTTLAAYLAGVQPTEWWQIAVVAVLVRAVNWAVSKLPAGA